MPDDVFCWGEILRSNFVKTLEKMQIYAIIAELKKAQESQQEPIEHVLLDSLQSKYKEF